MAEGATLNGSIDLCLRGGAHGAAGRQDAGLLHDGGHALLVQHGHQGLAHTQGLQGLLRVKGGIHPEGPGGGPQGLLVIGGVGPQGVLHPVADLPQNAVGNVGGILGDEPDADALGTDQPHHLLHLLHQGLWGSVEQKMGLVEEEGQLGLVQVARFGQHFIQLGEHPQQEGGVQQGMLEQLLALQNVHDAPAVFRPVHPVGNIQSGLAEEDVAALVLQLQQRTLDGAHGLAGDVAVGQLVLLGIVTHVLDHAPQVLQVDEQQPLVVGDAEYNAQDAALGAVQPQQAAQQLRPHLGDGGADGMALPAVYVEEADGVGGVVEAGDAHGVDAAADVLVLAAGQAHAGQVPLDVRQEHGDPHVAEGLRQHLQCDGFAGAGGASDEAVAVGHAGLQVDGAVAGSQPDLVRFFRVHRKPSRVF